MTTETNTQEKETPGPTGNAYYEWAWTAENGDIFTFNENGDIITFSECLDYDFIPLPFQEAY